MSESPTEIQHTQNPEAAVETIGAEPSVSTEAEAATAETITPTPDAAQDEAVYTTALI